MKVKRLEIQGFKSFKDKTVIHFDEGVTGIVGPNGCGKSNIVDSFFWVMGEQSIKHMRADGQMDLIFNGSEKYAPLNAAEVSLVLSTGASKNENADLTSSRDLPVHLKYDEISVTRRLNRDGTSEFFINGQPCRLKDIHELFMDTGAGPKAYSIIEQGQIARIIQAKSEDRRVLVEEAAGIVKFKARKKESLRKIEATQVNLNRINDIIAEIERQLNSLERQAQKARQYKEYKEELLQKEMLVGRKKLFGLKSRIQYAESEVSNLNVIEVENRSNLQTAELRIENFKIQLSEIQRNVEDRQLELQNLQREISQQDTRLQIQKRKIDEVENSSQSLDSELHELEQLLLNYREVIIKLEAEEQELSKKHQDSEQVLKAHQNELEQAKVLSEKLGQDLDQEKREHLAMMTHQNEFSNQIHADEARVEGLNQQVLTLDARLLERTQERESIAKQFLEIQTQFDTDTTRTNAQKNRHDDLKLELSAMEAELTQLRKDSNIAREEFAKSESKHRAIQEFVDSHEGFKIDVKNILDDSELSVGLSGVLADFITAKPGYELALQAVLRDFLENIIVQDKSRAQEVLTTLKSSNKGRAAFWSIDMLTKSAYHQMPFDRQLVYAIAPDAKSIRDVANINLPQSESILALFDRIFIVNNLNDALQFADKALGLGITFVSLEGDFVDRFGRIIGGCVNTLQGGILSRKTELQNLSDNLTQIRAHSEQLEERLLNLEQAQKEKRSEYEASAHILRDLEIQLKHTERDLASSQSRLSILNNEIEKLTIDHQNMTVERTEIRNRLDTIRNELKTLTASSQEREVRIQQLGEDSLAAEIRLEEFQNALTQFRVESASSAEKLRHLHQDLERNRYEQTQDLQRKDEIERMMNRKLDEKDMLSQELVSIESEMIDLNESAQNLEDELKIRKNELERLNTQLSESFDDQRISMKKVEETTSELNRLKLEHEKCSLEFSMLFQSMFQKYGLEEDKIAPQDDEETKVFDQLDQNKEQELQQEVDRLHERIRKLGEVNVLAVEEYDEQKKRFDFLVIQREDLLKSIADLEKAIERINKTSEERFKIAFEEINKRFEKIFPIVFGGGWGRLEMTNPADLNETGIDIIAEPPGKKVSSIQLMSGGEKALTAVALIFSIFLIKPSPFCVLDEVDAPLDDHNVGKFNALLNEMATRSQFIIITHNKRTMELNDKLYGVTMEEPGVSKMVSIQLH